MRSNGGRKLGSRCPRSLFEGHPTVLGDASEIKSPAHPPEVLLSQELLDGIEAFIDKGHDELYVRRLQ